MQSKLCGCEEFLRHSSVGLAPKNEKKPYGYHANMWTAYRKIDSEIKHPPVVELRKSKLR